MTRIAKGGGSGLDEDGFADKDVDEADTDGDLDTNLMSMSLCSPMSSSNALLKLG